MITNVPDMFGCYVFNDKIMKDRLPKETYKALKKTIESGASLDIEVANGIVDFREIYSPFVRDLELLYIEGMTKEMLLERRPYIII